MKSITDLETLCEWARDCCKQKGFNIWIGEDKVTNQLVIVIQDLYAIIPMDGWLHDAQFIIEATIDMARDKILKP
jgi:hypothetical protein